MSGYQGPTLRQMEYVLAVARTGKFGEAARECGVSQPALSKQIQEAEALAGGPLFERARPRALLTVRGEAFVKRAKDFTISRSRQACNFPVHERRSGPHGHV